MMDDRRAHAADAPTLSRRIRRPASRLGGPTVASLLFAPLLLCAGVTAARAQWSPFANVNTPVAVTAAAEARPRVVSDGAGGAYVVWELGAADDIAAQHLSPAGSPLWARNGLTLVPTGLQRHLRSVAADGARGAILVWDEFDGSAAYDVLACRVDSAGFLSWGADPVPVCTAPWNQHNAELAMVGPQVSVVVWQDARHNGYTIYAQKLGADGAPQWQSDGLLVCNEQQSQLLPRVVADGFGGVIVAWEDGRNTGSTGGDIYAQRVDADGRLLWKTSGVPVCAASGTQKAPSLAADGSGGVVIAWQDQRSGSASADIYAQHLDASGQAQWLANGIVVCSAPNMQYDPRVLRDSAGGVIVCWTDGRTAYSERIVAQRITMSSGSVLWTPNGLDVCPVGQNMRSPAMIADSADGVFLVWQDGRAGADNLNIYAQRLDGTGARLWGLMGVAICNAGGKQTAPQLCPGEGGGAIIVWEDGRDSTRPDVYASFVSAGGLIPVELLAFSAEPAPGMVTLRWSTASERDNAGFELLRSADGNAWEHRAFVPGRGTGPGSAYRYDDPVDPAFVPGGELRYRLLQRDTDGSEHPSPMLTVRLVGAAPAAPSLRLAPQPAATSARLFYTLPRGGAVDCFIVDALGRRVATLAADGGAGAHALQLPLRQLPPGSYTVVLLGPDGLLSAPLIRIR